MADWTTSNYTGANPTQDPDPITGIMPDLADESAPGAGDGDAARSSHVEKPRDKLQTLAKVVGDSASPPEPAGSICEILDRDHSAGDAKQLRLLERASAPTNAANKGFIYVKDDGGDTELYYEDDGGAEAQLTADGKSMAETLKESGGQLLPVGAVAAGQLLARVGATVIGQTKRTLNESTDPGAGDDSGDGFSVGSIWINTTDDKAWICLDDTAAAAIWEQINGGGSATSPLTAKGQIWGYSTVDAAIPAGTVDGQVLTRDNNEATGVKWANAPSAAQGVRIYLSDGQPVNSINLGSSDTKIMPEDEASMTFYVPVAGTYKISFGVNFYASGGGGVNTSCQAKVVFDEGEASEQTLGYNDQWQTRVADTTYGPMVFPEAVELTVGNHTVTAYAKEVAGTTALILGSTSQPATGPWLELLLLTGNGAGGEVIEDAAPDGTAVTLDKDVEETIVSDSITISENDAIQVNFTGYAKKVDASSATELHIRLYEGANLVGPDPLIFVKANSTLTLVRDNVSFSRRITGLGAGTYTISVKGLTVGGGGGNDYDVHPTSFQLSVARGGVPAIDIEPWRYLDAANLPTGAASPEAVWQFDGSANELDDRTANGHDLTVEGGSELHAAAEGLIGFVSNNSFRLYDGASPAGLRTTGAVTAEFLVSMQPGVLSVLFGIYGTDETEAMNNLYAFTVRDTTRLIRADHEYSTGSDETHDFSAMPLFGPVQHIAITRSSNGLTYKLYIDGQLVDTQVASNAPTGGGSATPRLFGSSANYFGGAMFCARITKEEWSAAQVLESYQYCRKLQ